jgi:PAS domain S-box-containing protein
VNAHLVKLLASLDLHPPASATDLHPPASATDLHPPASATDLHPPASATDLHPPASAATAAAPTAEQWLALLPSLNLLLEQQSQVLVQSQSLNHEMALLADRRHADLALLEWVQNALVAENNLERAYHLVVEAIAEAFGFSQVSLYAVEYSDRVRGVPEGQNLQEHLALSGQPDHEQMLLMQHQVGYHQVINYIPLHVGIMGKVARTAKPIWINDVRADPEFIAAFDGITAEICLPILSYNSKTVAAVLNVETLRPGGFSQADYKLLLALGKHLEAAIWRTESLQKALGVERRYQKLLDQIEEALFETDEDGRITTLSRAWYTITGVPVAEMIGFSLENLMNLPLQLSSGEIREIEVPIARADGQEAWLGIRFQSVEGDHGEFVGYGGLISDVTTRRRALDAVRQAQHQAEQASRAKSEFLSRMSHELRTPLNAMLGFTQLLELSDLDHDQSMAVEEVLRAGKHLLSLINEVLDINRIEAGRMSITLNAFAVEPMLHECLKLIEPLAAKRDIRLMFHQTQPETWLLADVQRLRQVMLNLLSNAIKYNQTNGWVKVGITRGDLGWRISVHDGGAGIPLELQERLFTPFERLGADRRGIEGSGIGLILTQRLVQLMGGHIGFESAPGQGSCFWVEFLPAEAWV